MILRVRKSKPVVPVSVWRQRFPQTCSGRPQPSLATMQREQQDPRLSDPPSASSPSPAADPPELMATPAPLPPAISKEQRLADDLERALYMLDHHEEDQTDPETLDREIAALKSVAAPSCCVLRPSMRRKQLIRELLLNIELTKELKK